MSSRESPVFEVGTGQSEVGTGQSADSALGVVWLTFKENRLALVGLVVLFSITLFAFAGPLIYHTNQRYAEVTLLTLPPSSGHVLGTDENGLDVLGRLMLGGQSSLEVGIGAAVVATFLGMTCGSVAGFFGGVVDIVLMRLVDVFLSVPMLLILIIVSVLFTPSKFGLVFVIGAIAWLVPARLVRGETLTLRTRDYVLAARTAGSTSRRILYRHIIPNTAGTIIVNATFQVADAILLLASLSFLGLGIHFPGVDWGSMLAAGMPYIYDGDWWLIYPPAVAILLVVVSINFVGDALRDSLESRLQHR
jgi:peptide/nickel transport system permease protein